MGPARGAAVSFVAVLLAAAMAACSSLPAAPNRSANPSSTAAPGTVGPMTSPGPTPSPAPPTATLPPASPAPSATPLAVTNPDGPRVLGENDLTKLLEHARGLSNFAGVWVAQNQTDFHVAVVGDLQAAADKLRPFVSANMTLYLHPAEFTYAELKNVADKIVDDWNELSTLGVQVSSVSVDERANRVAVGIDPVDETVSAELAERYGSVLALEYVPVGHVPVATWPVEPETLIAVEGDATSQLISCGGPDGFPAAVVDDPKFPDAPPGPQRDALEAAMGRDEFALNGTEHWRLASQSADMVLFVTHTDYGWIYASVRFEDGEWGLSGSGDCHPMAAPSGGYGAASWAPDPAFAAPTADSTELHILVWEFSCASGSPATGRMSQPIVSYGADSFVMTIGVTPVGGVATCIGAPGTPATVMLPRPLGDRSLLDGNFHPAASPKAF
jgi:hypothetical protein